MQKLQQVHEKDIRRLIFVVTDAALGKMGFVGALH